MPLEHRAQKASEAAQTGILANALLTLIKLVTGIAGNSYALIADAVESAADVFGSLVVWSGLRISAREPDEAFPFGYGKAEHLAAAVVGVMILAAGIGISIQAVREILSPQTVPAAYTLFVLVGVVVFKEILFRRLMRTAQEVDSSALHADAWHQRSDAITSLAAAVGISLAVFGGPRWAAAEDWAALLAAAVILANGVRILLPTLGLLMDRSPPEPVMHKLRQTAEAVPGVDLIETLRVRRSGLGFYVDIHVQADPELPLRDAHALGGRVRCTLTESFPEVLDVLVHMEPYEPVPSADSPL